MHCGIFFISVSKLLLSYNNSAQTIQQVSTKDVFLESNIHLSLYNFFLYSTQKLYNKMNSQRLWLQIKLLKYPDAQSCNTSGRQVSHPLQIITVVILRKCVHSFQHRHVFGPSDSPACSTTSNRNPRQQPLTINWRSQRNLVRQRLGKLSLIIYLTKCITYYHVFFLFFSF